MNVDTLYRLWKYILGKNGTQGYASPADFRLTLQQGQISYVSYLLGSFQSYTPGRAVAKVEFGQNSTVRQRLTPVIYGYNLSVDVSGHTPYPADFLQVDAMWSLYGLKKIRWTPQDQLAHRYGSVISPIADNPIYLIEDRGLQFYPSNIGAAKMSYIKTPPEIVWGYTLDVNGRPVYNPTTSQDPIWDDTSVLEILVRSLRIVGVSLQFNEVSQYANEIKQIGQ